MRGYIVAALRSLLYGARAARIERCPPRFDPLRPVCNDRHCPRCGLRWVRKHMERLRACLPTAEGTVMVRATIKGVGATTRTAARAYRTAWERFRRIARRHGWITVGARHLARAKGDAWIDHAHVVVAVTQGDLASLAAAVRAAGAWVNAKPIKSLDAVLRYAVNGAVRPPVAEHMSAWFGATIGRPTIIAPRSTDKRTRATVTHSRPVAEQAGARVVALLSGSPPMAASALRRRLTPAHRSALPATLATMEQAGELRRVAGRRGDRWTLAEREAA